RHKFPGKPVVVRLRPAPLPAVFEIRGQYHRKGGVQHPPAGAPLPATEPETQRQACHERQPADRRPDQDSAPPHRPARPPAVPTTTPRPARPRPPPRRPPPCPGQCAAPPAGPPPRRTNLP